MAKQYNSENNKAGKAFILDVKVNGCGCDLDNIYLCLKNDLDVNVEKEEEFIRLTPNKFHLKVYIRVSKLQSKIGVFVHENAQISITPISSNLTPEEVEKFIKIQTVTKRKSAPSTSSKPTTSRPEYTVEEEEEEEVEAEASFAGDYLTYQGNILKSILTYFSNDELRELKLVSKEWNRTVTNILDSREYFHSTVDQHRNLISVVFPLKPQQCSIIFGTKLIFSLLTLKKIRNAHLLNIKEYEKFCVVSGNYLPPVVVQTAEERTSGIEYYFMKEKISHCNFLSHDFRSKSVNVSIFQFHNEFCEKGSLKELKAVLEESKDGPVKGIMVFVKNNTDIPSLFTNLVQSIQSEAFTCAGVSGNARVLLPEVHAGKYEVDAGKHEAHAGKYEVDAGYEAHAGKYDTTLLVFRGQGLRVTSDIFFWNERRREWIARPRFNDFLKSLSELAGPAPVDGARLVYIFECCAVKGLVKKEELNKYFPSVEIVFVRTNINEFFRNTNDGERTEVGTDLHGYSSVFNIYDFSGVQKTWSRLDGDD